MLNLLFSYVCIVRVVWYCPFIILQHKDTATSLEFAYAVMLDVSCIITNGSHYLIGGSHYLIGGSHYLIGGSQCLVSHVLSDLHHMIQSSCTKDKSEYSQWAVCTIVLNSGTSLQETLWDFGLSLSGL